MCGRVRKRLQFVLNFQLSIFHFHAGVVIGSCPGLEIATNTEATTIKQRETAATLDSD